MAGSLRDKVVAEMRFCLKPPVAYCHPPRDTAPPSPSSFWPLYHLAYPSPPPGGPQDTAYPSSLCWASRPCTHLPALSQHTQTPTSLLDRP